jgi:hypothetical protein
MHPDTTHRGRLLYTALGFLGLDVPPCDAAGAARAACVARYLARHRAHHTGAGAADRDLSLTRYRDRWGAICQPVPDAVGAVQQAAFQALHRGRNWRADPWAL